MTRRGEVVVDGVRFGEGPVWVPDRRTCVVTSVMDGCLWEVDLDGGTKRRFADTGGGANGAALARDGGLLVTQNGGLDYSKLPLGTLAPLEPPPYAPVTPGLQRAFPDGTVEYLLDTDLNAPNDLVVHADGTVYFTDPGHWPPPDGGPIGRVMAYATDGGVRTLAAGFLYCNGIALDPDGHLVVVEGRGLQRFAIDAPGEREWVIETLGPGGGDGFCVDVDGRFYVASTREHGIRVVEDGAEVDFLAIPGEGLVTNCCFAGPDLTWLVATDAVPGNVVVWDGMPTPGLPLHTWRA